MSTSNRFQMLYLSSQLGPSLNKDVRKVDNPQTMDDIAEKCMEMIEFVNGIDGHGFTVMGWYKRGTVKDAATANNDNGRGTSERTTIDSGKMQLHVSMIKLSDDSDENYIDGDGDNESLKYNVQKLHGAMDQDD